MHDCNVIEENSTAVTTAGALQHLDLHSYDYFLHCNSGGKDSVASLLWLLEAGVDRNRIELHHQLVDGPDTPLMDWPVSRSYVDKLGEALGIPVYHSWRQGGFLREMLRDETRTAPVTFQSLNGAERTVGGERGPEGRRCKFPQVSADLKVRWCSGSLKIDVFARILTNDERFQGKRILVITGERAEESASRANYHEFEPHRTDLRNGVKVQRHVDHLRPIHKWPESKVWAIMEKHRVRPHPAYWLHYSRASCRGCIFNGPNEWATLRTHMPEAFHPIAAYEDEFGVTIHRTLTVNEQADRGVPHPCSLEMLLLAESTDYYANIIVEEGSWKLPPGAYKKGNGPS
jgi:3'-phosphoadenosine 5'-phosphosulfate sulfotransferase (PAPS reductase)/FAD synthetase